MPSLPDSIPQRRLWNIPYDKQFERLYLAYIAGITSFGFGSQGDLGNSRRAETARSSQNRLFGIRESPRNRRSGHASGGPQMNADRRGFDTRAGSDKDKFLALEGGVLELT